MLKRNEDNDTDFLLETIQGNKYASDIAYH